MNDFEFDSLLSRLVSIELKIMKPSKPSISKINSNQTQKHDDYGFELWPHSADCLWNNHSELLVSHLIYVWEILVYLRDNNLCILHLFPPCFLLLHTQTSFLDSSVSIPLYFQVDIKALIILLQNLLLLASRTNSRQTKLPHFLHLI